MRLVGALAVLSLLVVGACRRPDPGANARVQAELAGGWVREIRGGAAGVEGFDLRADGSVGLLNIFSMNGLAWNVSRGELVLSTNTDRFPKPNPSRLHIVSLEADVLTLDAGSPDYLAGTWRRGPVGHVAGVVTYLEPVALPADARVEVRLLRADRLIARTLFAPKGPVPVAFTLSYLPEAAADAGNRALEASIVAVGGPIFATARPLALSSNADAVDVIVQRVQR